jgi:hypothetical protein
VADKEAILKGILQKLIHLFIEHHSKWRQLVSVVAGNTASDDFFFILYTIFSNLVRPNSLLLFVLFTILLICQFFDFLTKKVIVVVCSWYPIASY